MADKTLRELIAESSPELRETYSEIGGLEQLLEPSSNPMVNIQMARLHGENVRAHAKMQEENRAREQRKAELAKEEEARRIARHKEDEARAKEEEAALKAKIRREMPLMTDAAFEQAWPQIRTQHYIEQRDAMMSDARNNGNVLGDLWGMDGF